jgi:VWFA-related protein
MNRSEAAWLLSCVLASGIATPAGALESPPSFPAATEVVTIDAVVLDRQGRPVTGLTPEDFVIYEDGHPHSILNFETVALALSADPPAVTAGPVASNDSQSPDSALRTFTIVVDDVHLTPAVVARVRSLVRDFILQLHPGDRIVLLRTSGGAWWTEQLPEGKDNLLAIVDQIEGKRPTPLPGRMTDWEALQLYVHRDSRVGAEVARRYYENGILADLPTAPDGDLQVGEGHPAIRAEASQVYHDALLRSRASLRSLGRTLDALASAKGRKTVFLISEGFVHDPTLTEFKALADTARRTNAVVHYVDVSADRIMPNQTAADIGQPIDTRDLTRFFDQRRLLSEGSDSVALDSGGETVRAGNLADAMGRLSTEARSCYLLGYRPSHTTADRRYHKIQVVVRNKELVVRARRGYYALPAGATALPEDDELSPEVRAGLDSPFDSRGIGLRLTSHLLSPLSPAKTFVLLTAEVDVAALRLDHAHGRHKGGLDTYIVVASRDTGEYFHNERRVDLDLPDANYTQVARTWVPIRREFELPTGRYQAHLLVRDSSGRLGTVRHAFSVPPTGLFRISTPILTDTTITAAAGTIQPLPIARRVFFEGSQLVCLFEALDAAPDPADGKPRVRSRLLLRNDLGDEVLGTTPARLTPGPDGRLSQQYAFPLRGVRPGSYELALTVTDDVAQKAVETRIAFEVEPAPTAP